jgi:hypothetical protein
MGEGKEGSNLRSGSLSNDIESAVNTNMDISKEWQRPRLVSILFCDSYKMAEDGKADLIGVFDRIYVHPEIKNTPPFTLFVRTAETLEGLIQIICYAPDGEIPTVVNYASAPESAFTPNLPANLQGISHMNPFHISMEGIYWFDVTFRGQSLGGAGLAIAFRETEDKTGGTDTYI